MFLIFKPVYGGPIHDPDGFKKRYSQFEEEYAAQILKERQPKRRKKLKQLSFKNKIEEQLNAGKTIVEIADNLTQEVLASDEQLTFTPEMQADISRIVAQYQKQIRDEIQQSVLAIVEQLDNIRQTRERQKRLKAKKIKILLLLASLDDEHD